MAMSRDIPINVHPEFRKRTTIAQQGKPRIFTRSSSLPSGPKLRLVMETLNPKEADQVRAKNPEEKETMAEYPNQGANGTKSNHNYDNFWNSSSPIDSEERHRRRHFFAENPFIGDLEKVFEDQYKSDLTRPVKLGRRNTYSEGSSRESQHSAPKIRNSSSERNKKETKSFDIPVKVEFDLKIKDGDESEKKSFKEGYLSEPKVGKSFSGESREKTSFDVPVKVEFDEMKGGDERDRKCSEVHSVPKIGQKQNRKEMSYDVPVQVEFNKIQERDDRENKDLENKTFEKGGILDSEQTNKPVHSEVDKEQNRSEVFRVGEPCAISFGGSKVNKIDKGQVLDNSEDDTATEINEGKFNIEQGQVIIEVGEQSSSTSLPQEFKEENESRHKLLTIQNILKKAEGLEKKVDAFSDNSKTKEYLILEETLTCCLIELDGIETNQNENIRLARKTAVQQLQKTLAQLEKKVLCNRDEEDEFLKWDHSLEKEGNNSAERI